MGMQSRTMTTFSSAQLAELEQHFLQGRYLTPSQLAELSQKLDLGKTQVKIWFKDRRRRHKIQSVTRVTYYLCDEMSMSSSVANQINIKKNGSASSSGSSSGGHPSLQSLSLNNSEESKLNALTPSPIPTTPVINLMEHYGEYVLDPYYYNNNRASSCMSHLHASRAGAAGSQYYPPSDSLQRHFHLQQQYHSPHPHQFQMQLRSHITNKQDPGLNINNQYAQFNRGWSTYCGGHSRCDYS